MCEIIFERALKFRHYEKATQFEKSPTCQIFFGLFRKAGLKIRKNIKNKYVQGISSQTDKSNLALVKVYIMIFADIVDPMCSLERHFYAKFISFYFF